MMGGLMMSNINLILVVSVLIFCFVIIFIIYKDFKEKKLIIDENRKREKEQFYKQYPQFFVRDNWSIIDNYIFCFKPTNEEFRLIYTEFSNGSISINDFVTPLGFSRVFNLIQRNYIKQFLRMLIQEILNNKRSELIKSVNEKYPSKI